jgi:glycosyltransferase involved in cell wall biosynthesis/putative flippase GtrA
VLFSVIGGLVFLLGLGVQVVMTGKWHVPPAWSYIAQAVISVETSFLLNRWLTWRDRDAALWAAWARYNVQKAVTIALNLALYVVLIRLGVNYLAANVALTGVFTAVNYVAGDRLVFAPGRALPPAEPAPAVTPAGPGARPAVSVVIPCRNNQHTIGAAVRSLLDQDYPGLAEIIVIGSPDDLTWSGLEGISDPRVTVFEVATPPGLRDANFKRDTGIRMTRSELVALVDSDIVLPVGWMSCAVAALQDSGASCVTGGMMSIHDTFWGRYTDSCWIGAKTPRIALSYTVNKTNFGVKGNKPPVTANALFTRALYDECAIDPSWSHGSYEDYEWFWRVCRAGHEILVSMHLFGWHHHRRGLRALAREYRRSSRGCAYFIRAHTDSPFARRRLRQAVALPLVAAVTVIGATAAAAEGHGTSVAVLALAAVAVLIGHQVTRTRRMESAAYPLVGAALGVVFTTGLITNLLGRGAPQTAPAGEAGSPELAEGRHRGHRSWLRIITHPLSIVLSVQAGLSLSLIWSNAAFGDEADYLSVGHELIAHWLHGMPWPASYGENTLSGSPLIYPPLGAMADGIGGLAGARILSLVLMLLATVFLWFTARHLFGAVAAVLACGLWVTSEPVIRLAFATYDPLSICLTAMSGWLALQAALRKRRGEFVALAAISLALANATAYSGVVIDPVVLAFAFLIWRTEMGKRQAAYCTAWFATALAVVFGGVMTMSRSWPGIMTTVISRGIADHQQLTLVARDIWSYSGFVVLLALASVIITAAYDGRRHLALAGLLACASLVVPAAQIHEKTAVSLDKHLAYGIWFAVMAAGYGLARLLREAAVKRSSLMTACSAVVFAYPAILGWQSAWYQFHGWPDATSFAAALRPVVERTSGEVYAGSAVHIATYYETQRDDWQRFSANALRLDPPVPPSRMEAYYASRLAHDGPSVIALYYVTTLTSPSLPEGLILTPGQDTGEKDLLNVVAANTNGNGLEIGLPALTEAIEADTSYRLVAAGPYNSADLHQVYAIWQKVQR